MKIKVPQAEIICNIRYVKCCDYAHSYTCWSNENEPSPLPYTNDNFINSVINDKRNCISVYCKTDYLILLFNQCKNIKKNIILISGCSDYPITKELYMRKPKNIVKWYGENINYSHNDLIPIPMGSISATWIGNDIKNCEIPRHKDFKLVNIDYKEPEHINLAFMCFSIETNKTHRQHVYDYFENKEWVTNLCKFKTGKRTDDDIFMYMVYNHSFVICPFGNGIDCGRTWMTIQLGSIPIMPYHLCFEKWAENLPIILYKNINEITESYLMGKIEEFKSKEYNYDYLKTSYWKQRFENDCLI